MRKVFFPVLAWLMIASQVSAGSATIAWDANTEPDLAGYRVYYGTASRGAITDPKNGGYPAANRIDVYGTTTKTIDNLSEGQTYYFSVTAFDTSNNESPYSIEKTKLIATSASICSSFTYSAWSTCSSQGTRTRTVLSALPGGCSGGSRVLQESCSPVSGGGDSGSGSGSGTSSGSGSGSGSVAPPLCESWTYGVWSDCVEGRQKRNVFSSGPDGCSGGSPEVERACTPSGPVICQYWTYGDWSACVNGKKSRKILVASPEACTGGLPELTTTCNDQLATSNSGPRRKNDDDNDGLSNELEIALGTDPKKADTDGDGFGDRLELLSGYDPRNSGKQVQDKSFASKHKGKIFIQTERNGEAWYVNPSDAKRYFLGRPQDALDIMSRLSLGVKHSFILANAGKAYDKKYRGRILLDVEDKGKAYYIDLASGKADYLGSPANAFAIIRKKGIGIKNSDIQKLETGLIE